MNVVVGTFVSEISEKTPEFEMAPWFKPGKIIQAWGSEESHRMYLERKIEVENGTFLGCTRKGDHNAVLRGFLQIFSIH